MEMFRNIFRKGRTRISETDVQFTFPKKLDKESGILDFRAGYKEVTKEELAENWRRLIGELTGPEFALGEINNGRYQLRFRNITLSTDPEERSLRVEEIITAGTDRTSKELPGLQYQFAAEKIPGSNPFDFIWTVEDEEAIRQFSDVDSQAFIMEKLGKNAVLIFDAKTEKGVQGVSNPRNLMTIFKNPQRKNEALLGILLIT